MPVKQEYSQRFWGNTQAHVQTSCRAVNAPADFLPLSVAEVKANLRITWDAEDDLLETYILLAESIVQDDIPEFVFRSTEFELLLDEFPNEIQIVQFPVQAVVSLQYYNLKNEQLELTEGTGFYSDIHSFPARLWSATNLAASASRFWPDVIQRPGAVQVRFIAGHATASDINKTWKQLLHLWVSHLYSNRSPVEQGRPSAVPYTIEYLTESIRKRRLG